VEPEKQPLLANNSETMFVSWQWPGNITECPLLGSRFLISKNRRFGKRSHGNGFTCNIGTVFSIWSMRKCYKQGTRLVSLWREDLVGAEFAVGREPPFRQGLNKEAEE
jgi:hypothetical protein